MSKDDLILAFFPCIYFCATSQMNFYFTSVNNRCKSPKERAESVLERSSNRERFFRLAVKMISSAEQRGLRLIMENPWSEQTFLKSNFVYSPSIIDNDRTLRGDCFKKPTAYWFVGCEPTQGKSIQRDKQRKRILETRSSKHAGLCSEERSMISPDYARNFICDFVLGKRQEKYAEPTLFDI